MKLTKLLKFAKKGSKRAQKSKGAAAAAAAAWPPGIKIGVFGHENTGKTSYFTVLYHQSKIDKKIQISVTDNDTSSEFLANYMAIWGFDSGTSMGTIEMKTIEKKFPEPTEKDKVLQFTSILDGKKKVPVVTYDYNGKAVSITEHTEEAEKIRNFMAAADGILFFFDPKILGADMEVQARTSAFISILEEIAPLKSRLPVPVGLVVTKADTLPGYSGEDSTILINPEDEQFVAENYEQFLEAVLNSSNVTANSSWASSVRKILVKTSEFLRVVVGRTLDFQIFFVSNTGNEPVKIGTDVGRSIYQPPDKINPCGVTEPFYWILNSVVRTRSLNIMRKITKYVAAASIAWIVLYSLPFVIHFKGLISRPYRVENSVLKSVEGNYVNMSEAQRADIMKAYNRYSNKWLVKKMFPEYQLLASRMKEVYRDFNMGPALARLDSVIVSITDIVSNPDLQPKYNPAKDEMIYNDTHVRLREDLEGFHMGDKTAVLYLRSDRVLNYWDLFNQYLKNREDTAVLEKISSQVAFNSTNAQNYDDKERQLGDALLNSINLQVSKPTPSVKSVRSGLAEYDQMKERLKSETDPAFVLGEAPARLEAIKGKLMAATHEKQIASINNFLAEVKKWNKRQPFTCVLQTVPDMGHLHIEVTGSGQSPTWSKQTQLLQGDEIKLNWKIGDDIYIAFDELRHPCNWGNKPSDSILLQSKYALFDMEGSVTFPNIGKTVVFSFKGGLKDKLPKLR